MLFTTKYEYRNYFFNVLKQKSGERQLLFDFLKEQFNRFNQLVKDISEESFWQILPEILGIDAKLSLLLELVQFEDLNDEDVIRIIEADYQSYFQELCGYDLKSKPNYSMIFNLI